MLLGGHSRRLRVWHDPATVLCAAVALRRDARDEEVPTKQDAHGWPDPTQLTIARHFARTRHVTPSDMDKVTSLKLAYLRFKTELTQIKYKGVPASTSSLSSLAQRSPSNRMAIASLLNATKLTANANRSID
ncbi:Aste57867_24890 [Aphanomyces stellatus]|uniref:Aste57867_24890 protein n=1 Tax=Aphanomyces stellatus TaxID=120398 RepID=A0A485LRN7_9STRA|nr:hypothetical protein As57867_024812 [Aphanomyces stellatus]VFU01524.1 Aste57867_24890 [Aphanomyces stellatus]